MDCIGFRSGGWSSLLNPCRGLTTITPFFWSLGLKWRAQIKSPSIYFIFIIFSSSINTSPNLTPIISLAPASLPSCGSSPTAESAYCRPPQHGNKIRLMCFLPAIFFISDRAPPQPSPPAWFWWCSATSATVYNHHHTNPGSSSYHHDTAPPHSTLPTFFPNCPAGNATVASSAPPHNTTAEPATSPSDLSRTHGHR